MGVTSRVKKTIALEDFKYPIAILKKVLMPPINLDDFTATVRMILRSLLPKYVRK